MALPPNESHTVEYSEIVFPNPEKELGKGMFGRVLQATFRNKPVAVKLMHEYYGQNGQSFVQYESFMLNLVKHENIVTCYAAFYGEKIGLILELMKGGSLHKLLHGHTHVQYSYCHVVGWSRQALEALTHLHNSKLVHRDLKPLNMLLTDDFLTLKLGDFGTARPVDISMSSNQGTMAYMAPEVFKNRKYDQRCDIYSFGVVLWEIMARKPPRSVKSVQLNEIKNRPTKIINLIEWFDFKNTNAMKFFKFSCWSDKPDERPTIGDIINALEPFRCNHYPNSCTSLIDSTTNKQAIASQLMEQGDNKSQYFFPPTIVHVPQNNTRSLSPIPSSSKIDQIRMGKLDPILSSPFERNGEKPLTSSQSALNLVLLNGNKNNAGVPPSILPHRKPERNRSGSNNLNLHRACWDGQLETAKLLLEKGAKIDVVNKNGSTPLHSACWNGHLEVVKWLREKGANINVVNNYGRTPLHYACWNGHLEVAKWLLEKGANINAVDKDGSTPLHLACRRGNLKTAELLLERGAYIDAVDKDGSTPLHLACYKGHLEVVKWLLDKGANINAKTKDDRTPLHYACDNGHLEVAKFLLETGAKIDAVNKYGNTPLHYACDNGHLEVAKFLLETGAKIDAVNKNGRTPLHYACLNGHLEVVKWLLEKGANIHAVNNYGSTPLHYACQNGHLEVAKLLLEKGANITVKDSAGNTPWDLAFERGFGDKFSELKPVTN